MTNIVVDVVQAEGLKVFMSAADPDLIKFYLALEHKLFPTIAGAHSIPTLYTPHRYCMPIGRLWHASNYIDHFALLYMAQCVKAGGFLHLDLPEGVADSRTHSSASIEN